MKKNQKKAFTLVELIVVITILAFLGTIGFLSFQGYSKTARDSRRIGDINNIKTALGLFMSNTGKYPLPDNGEEVSYSGDLLWTQGTIGDNVATNLSKNLKKKPLDPLLDIEYTYSTINSKKEYQVMAIYEGQLSQTNILTNTSYAADTYNIKVEGTYNEIFIKTDNYIVPTPSIINSEVDGSGITLNEDNILSQVITGGTNFPKLNIPNTTVQTRGLEINLSVYTGSITEDSASQDKINVMTAIQNAYSGTILSTTINYKSILDKTSDEQLVILADVMLLGNNNLPALDGECGIANNTPTLTAPSSNLCSNGDSVSVTTNPLTFTWFCNGINLGTNASCSAPRQYTHTITFDGNTNTSGTMSNQTIASGNSANLTTNAFVKTGYIFTGWATTSGGSVAYTNGASYTMGTSNLTLYAKWAVLDTVANCTTAGQIGTATTTYSGCNTADIIVCSGNGVGYILSACNVGATSPTSYGNRYQFGKSDPSWVIRNAAYSYDWKASGGTNGGSANDWGVLEANRNTATWSNSDSASRTKMQGPCASGYHVPTNAEWVGLSSAGGYGSNLSKMLTDIKLTFGGRKMGYDGSLGFVGGSGYYWSSSPYGASGYNLRFYTFPSPYIYFSSNATRSYSLSVRCFKN